MRERERSDKGVYISDNEKWRKEKVKYERAERDLSANQDFSKCSLM